MTRKDYELIASVLRETMQYAENESLNWNGIQTTECAIDLFAEALYRENGAFDEEKFRKACQT